MDVPRITFLLAIALLSGGMGIYHLPVGSGASNSEARFSDDVRTSPDTLEPYVETISETLFEYEMRPVPGGTVTVETSDGSQQVEVGPFWIQSTEVKWEPYKTFMYGRDGEEPSEEVDAISRPTNALAYLTADLGKPKEGYPVRAVTRKAARQYARWLTAKTDHTYRLPTAAEWIHACQSGVGSAIAESEEAVGEYAWHKGNSDGDTHPVGSKSADALGVHDLLGNVSEWTFTPEDSTRRVLRGGSYRTEKSNVRCSTVVEEKTQAWKRTDPQLPKSVWWFSDGPFVGFRVVRVPAGG